MVPTQIYPTTINQGKTSPKTSKQRIDPIQTYKPTRMAAKSAVLRDKAQNTLAILEVYIRAHPWKSATLVYGLGTFATAGVYAKQISKAALDLAHDPPSVPHNTPQIMYL